MSVERMTNHHTNQEDHMTPQNIAITDDDLMDELAASIAGALRMTESEARTIADTAEPLWDALGSLGYVDGFTGAECRRVLPAALAFIRRQANLRRDTMAHDWQSVLAAP